MSTIVYYGWEQTDTVIYMTKVFPTFELGIDPIRVGYLIFIIWDTGKKFFCKDLEAYQLHV